MAVSHTKNGELNFNLNILNREQQVNLFASLSDGLETTIICVYSGQIIDGLVICQPKSPPLFGGGNGGAFSLFVLSKDETIVKINGKNCSFDNSYVTGDLTLTIKSSGKGGRTRQIGPFGDTQSKGEAFLITNFDNFHLTNDQTGDYLGPIKTQTTHSGNYTLNHGLTSDDADEVVERALASCNSDNPYCDKEFDIDAPENANGHSMRLPEKSHFIKDGLDIADINQGHLANCWFLAALGSLAQKLPKDCPLKVKQIAVDRAIQREANSTDEAKAAGVYRFKFFRMGEWVDLVIDDKLPTYRRALPSGTNEWWVPLVEKAYAKFNGSYDKISFGKTCWALTDLTGGITVQVYHLKDDREMIAENKSDEFGLDLYDIFRQLQTRVLICTINRSNEGNVFIKRGLVNNHAYSLLQIDEVKLDDGSSERIVKIRNPYAHTEWDGSWSDGSEEWNHVSDEEKDRIKYANKNEGGFWMSFKDYVDEFEWISICILPELDPDGTGDKLTEQEAKDRDHRVIGTFVPGKNAPTSLQDMSHNFWNSKYHAHILLEFEQLSTKNDRRNIWLQYLLDTPLKETRYVYFNVYQLAEDAKTPEKKLTEQELRNATKMSPSLPTYLKNRIAYWQYYEHNGYLFPLEPNRKYIITATTSSNVPDKECKFMIRTIGPRITMKHLED